MKKEKEFAPLNIKPETLALLKKIKKETGVPFYHIIHAGVQLYIQRHKKVGMVKFEIVEEEK